jgi:hypothetical protein
MATAKDIVIKVIPSSVANPFVRRVHYSKTVMNTSRLHFGVFYNQNLHGVMSYGCPLDRSKVLGLVVDENGQPAPWNDMLELNRMAFDDVLPRNSESRAISISIKMIRKNAPHIKWLLSFADGTQCGDGTIYRASGFKLTGFSSGSMWLLPDYLIQLNGGLKTAHRMKIQNKSSPISKWILGQTGGKNIQVEECVKRFGGTLLDGYMLRYIKILDDRYHLAVKEIPYSAIQEKGAGMYKGVKR